jgi:hypothetical protein
MQPSYPGLSLVTRAGFTDMTLRQSKAKQSKATTFQMQKSKLTETERGETAEEQNQ